MKIDEIKFPFVDGKYVISKSKKIDDTFLVVNTENGNTYMVNPYRKICDCLDFRFRTTDGTCKHIEMLRDHFEIEEEKKEDTLPRGAKTAGAMVPDQQANQFAVMERMDETQILDELRGKVIDEYIYDFNLHGRKVTGLSIAGVKAIALRRGNIHADEPIIEERPDGWICKTKVTDINKNLVMWGVAYQPKQITLRDGRKIPDEFALVKATSKSERNAMRKLFDERIAVTMINEWREGKKGKKPREKPQGKPDDKSKKTELLMTDDQKKRLATFGVHPDVKCTFKEAATIIETMEEQVKKDEERGNFFG